MVAINFFKYRLDHALRDFYLHVSSGIYDRGRVFLVRRWWFSSGVILQRQTWLALVLGFIRVFVDILNLAMCGDCRNDDWSRGRNVLSQSICSRF